MPTWNPKVDTIITCILGMSKLIHRFSNLLRGHRWWRITPGIERRCPYCISLINEERKLRILSSDCKDILDNRISFLLCQFNITTERYKYLEYVFLMHISLFLSNVVTAWAHSGGVVTKSEPCDSVGNVNQWDKRDIMEQGIWVLLQASSLPR